MQRDIDLLLSILPSRRHGSPGRPEFNVQWVGHPLLDKIRRAEDVERTRLHALLAGSRKRRSRRIFLTWWEAALIMGRKKPGLKFILLSRMRRSRNSPSTCWASFPPRFRLRIQHRLFDFYLSRCSLAVSHRERPRSNVRLFGIPQIVVYRVHPLTYAVDAS